MDIPPTCLIRGCKGLVRRREWRGLCVDHFALGQVLVAQGKTTWAQLEAQGLAAPRPLASGEVTAAEDWFGGEPPMK